MTRVFASGLALTLAACLSSCLIQEQDARCEGALTCDDCLSESGCGWCGDGTAGTCLPGTSVMPTGGTAACPLENWYFRSCTENAVPVSDCALHRSCSACADLPECGWCATAGDCRDSANSGGCALVEASSSCDVATCASNTACGDCHTDRCTWCDTAGGRCVPPGGCSALDYTFRSDESCPPVNNCAGASSSCSGCLAMPGCGYCTGNRECLSTSYGERTCVLDYWITDRFSCP